MKQTTIARMAAVLATAGALSLANTGAMAALTPVTVDQIICQSATGLDQFQLSGTVSMDFLGGANNQLEILLRNTTPGAAVGSGFNSPATLLLSGIGIQLGTANITGGSVFVAAGSTGVNFTGPAGTDISSQWAYANQSIDGFSSIAGVLTVNRVMTSVENGQATPFSGSGSIDGPGYGAISSALVTSGAFGHSQPGVNDTIRLLLNLDKPVSVADINNGNVVLAFGSPTALVPEPATIFAGTILLLPLGVSAIRVLRHRKV